MNAIDVVLSAMSAWILGDSGPCFPSIRSAGATTGAAANVFPSIVVSPPPDKLDTMAPWVAGFTAMA